MKTKFTQKLSTSLRRRLAVALVGVLMFAPVAAEAAALSPRSVQVSSSAQGALAGYVVNATTATAASIGSIKFEFCDAATGACVTPAGVDTTATNLTAQSGATGFTLVNATNGSPYITRLAGAVGAGTPLSYTLSNVANPSAANLSYYVRITTYTGNDGATGPVDTGTVALSTAQPVQLTGVTPEILVFCVGTNITGNCTTISGSSIDFGDFSPTATRSGTSLMQAQTNAANGYVITVNGTTMASGVNTIPALPAQTASVLGTSQFGLNLRSNTTPPVGTDVSGAGIGTVAGNYNTPDQFRFVGGDIVATAPSPTNANTYTTSYMVNIGGAQAAGVYTTTMTYICTAAF
jgi:hypothetical protein